MLKKNTSQPSDPNSVFEALSRSADFTNERSHAQDVYYRISYFRSLINGNLPHEQILPLIKQTNGLQTLEKLKERIPKEARSCNPQHVVIFHC